MSCIWIIDYSNDTITFGEDTNQKFVFRCCGRKITTNKNICEMSEQELEMVKDYLYDDITMIDETEISKNDLIIVPCN